MNFTRINSIVLLALFFSITLHSFSQTEEIQMPYLKGKLYGFANSKGQITIEPKYDYVSLFINGFAQVRLNNKWGVIKQDGTLIIEVMANSIYRFDSNGLAKIKAYDKFGVINQLGEYVVPLEYYGVEIKKNYIQLRNSIGQVALLNLKGKTFLDFKYDQFNFNKNKSITSNVIIVKQENQFGLIQIKKNKVKKKILPQYKSLKLLNNELLIAEKNDKYGLVDYKNNIILPFNYDTFKKEANYLLAEQDLEYKIIIKVIKPDYLYYNRDFDEIKKEYDHQNKIVHYLMTQKEVDRLNSYGVDLNRKPHIKTLYTLINNQGQIIIPSQFGSIYITEHNLIQVRTNQRTLLYNSNGKLISPLEFDKVDDIREDLILVRINTKKDSVDNSFQTNQYREEPIYNKDNTYKFGFIDTTGKIIIPIQYNYAFAFNKNMAPVKLNEKWALINKQGELITTYKYDLLYYAGNNRFAFQIGKRWGLLDLKGQEINPATYYGEQNSRYNKDNFGGYSALIFKNGIAKTSKLLPGFRQARTTVIDTNGVQLFPSKYESIEESEVKDVFKVSLKNHDHDRKSFGLIDKNGNELVPVYQNAIWWFEHENVFCVAKHAFRQEYIYYNSKGEKVESPYIKIEKEELRDYKQLSNGYFQAKYNSKLVYFTPSGIALYEN